MLIHPMGLRTAHKIHKGLLLLCSRDQWGPWFCRDGSLCHSPNGCSSLLYRTFIHYEWMHQLWMQWAVAMLNSAFNLNSLLQFSRGWVQHGPWTFSSINPAELTKGHSRGTSLELMEEGASLALVTMATVAPDTGVEQLVHIWLYTER